MYFKAFQFFNSVICFNFMSIYVIVTYAVYIIFFYSVACNGIKYLNSFYCHKSFDARTKTKETRNIFENILRTIKSNYNLRSRKVF